MAVRITRDRARKNPALLTQHHNGDSGLTSAAYWEQAESKTRWGILEIDPTHVSANSNYLYAVSRFWGFESRLEAESFAVLGNLSQASYDKAATRKKKKKQRAVRELAAYAWPGSGESVCINGTHWRVPPTFPVAHQSAYLDELVVLFRESYLPLAKKSDPVTAAQELHVFATLAKRLRSVARALPADMCKIQPGMFLNLV